MTRKEALQLIQAAGIRAVLNRSADELCDDTFDLNGSDEIAVQISAGRDGLEFCAVVYSGDGDDFGATHGQPSRDPVAAAREALAMALA